MSVCCLILILLPLSCMGGDVRQTLFSNTTHNVMFDEFLINSVSARSKLDCARRCSSDASCETFTFTRGFPIGTCRLHSQVMTSESPGSSAADSRAYTVKTEKDVDECDEGTSDCDQTCSNTVGSFTCDCNTGYVLNSDGKTCDDVDECTQSTSDCDQTCTNTVGSFTCDCNTGYVLNSDGKTCDDVDECTQDTSDCDQTCSNSAGSFTCDCNTGYVLNSDGKTCDDVDECTQSTSDCDQTCSNSAGSFTCDCNTGYVLNSDGKTCDDVDECTQGTSDCDHTCSNTVGSFTCDCNTGYVLNSDGKTCDEVDECTQGTSDCDQTCTNTEGSFTCDCNTGYVLNSDGKTCNDVDECTQSTTDCEQTCSNTVGSFMCGCNTGYVLNSDGNTCDDEDECTQGTSDCEHACSNTVGSFTCDCNTNYVLNADGKTCDHVMCAADTEGWTVFQRRHNGSVDFYRRWTDYVNGFGNSGGEYWMGLENLRTMTSSGTWKVRIDVSDWAGNKACATYTGFYITGSSDNYRLMLNPGSYSGNAGDSLSYSRGRPFSTHDANRDRCSDRYFNCARTWHGAWWFDCCFSAHLNGEYKPSSATAYSEGILWENFRGFHYSLKFAEMKLKPL